MPDFSQSAVQIDNCNLSRERGVTVGSAVTASVTVSNSNTVPASVSVTFSSAGATVTESLGQIPANSTGSASVDFEYDEPGAYPVEVVIESVSPGGGQQPGEPQICAYTDTDGFVYDGAVDDAEANGASREVITNLITYQSRNEKVPECA